MNDKDSIHQADSSSATVDTVKLAIYCPSRPAHLGASTSHAADHHATPETIQVPLDLTVKELKSRLEVSYPGHPLASGQSLVWRGRRLSDDEVLKVVLHGTEQPETGYALHLTCPSDLWKTAPPTTPIKTPAASAAERLSALSAALTPNIVPASIPSSSLTQSFPFLPQLEMPIQSTPMADFNSLSSPVASTSGTTGMKSSSSISKASFKTFQSHLSALSGSQKADLIGRLSRAERYYATLSQMAISRQGVHMKVITSEMIQQMRDAGQVGIGFSSQSPTEMEESIEQLLDGIGLLERVRASEASAAKEFDAVEEAQTELLGGQSSSRVVNISGLPFLLHVPPQLSVPPTERKQAFVQMHKYKSIQNLLHTMVSLARPQPSHHINAPFGQPPGTQYPSAASRLRDAAQQQAAAGGPLAPVPGFAMPPPPAFNAPRGFGGVGIGPQAAARLAGPGMPTARFAVVINLDEILALAMPLLFLSIKLGFLIYVFGKHASTRKRTVMCLMALAWVIWEGYSIHRRRRAAEVRRHQQQQQNLQQQAAAARRDDDAQGQANGVVALDPPLHLDGRPAGQQDQRPNPAGGDQAEPRQFPAILAQIQERLQQLDPNGQQQVLRRRQQRNANGQAVDQAGGGEMPQQQQQRNNGRGHGHGQGSSNRPSAHRQPPSRLSPKYWLYLIAKVGLSAEAREMGLSRSVLRQLQSSSRQASTQNGNPIPPLPLQQQPQSADQSTTPTSVRIYQSQPLTARRAIRNLYIGMVLFIGTLIPEVERLRRKALIKRDKKLLELESTRRYIHLQNLENELKKLEEERKNLQSQLDESGGSSESQSGGAEQGQGSSSSHQSQQRDDNLLSNAPSTDSTQQGQRHVQDHTNFNTGLGITALEQSESDTDLFEPPYQDEAIQAALQNAPMQHSEGDSASASASLPAEQEAAASNSRMTSTQPAGPPQIRIDTDMEERNNHLLSPLAAMQRRADDQQQQNNNNHNPLLDDDYSGSNTPLLSPAMTEEDDDDRQEGDDEDGVGMILF